MIGISLALISLAQLHKSLDLRQQPISALVADTVIGTQSILDLADES